MSFRFGILGCGGIAGVFAEAVRSESKAAQIAAAASRDRQKAQAWAAERGISKACTYEELLEDPEIDAVYIALPNSLHAEWIARCAEAGKHILCEKPLTRTAAEAEEAVRKAEEAGVVLIEAFIYRFHPQTARIRELLDEGAIGPLRHVEAAFSYALDEEGRAQNIRTSAELAGGALMDVGCYCISFARFAFGAEPLSAVGRSALPRRVGCRLHHERLPGVR